MKVNPQHVFEYAFPCIECGRVLEGKTYWALIKSATGAERSCECGQRYMLVPSGAVPIPREPPKTGHP